jgi:hypothetical protein
MRWIAVVTVVLVMLGSACSQDSPKKKRARDNTEAPRSSVSPTKNDEAQPLAAASKSTSKTTAPLLGANDRKAGAASTSGSAVQVLWGLDFGSDAVLVAGINSFDKLYVLADQKLKKYGLDVPIMSKEAVLAQGQQMLALSDMGWFDRTRAIKVVMWNPKKSREALLLLPITSKDALIKALPTTREAGVQDNAFAINVAGIQFYLNVVAGHVAVSADAKLFSQAQTFLSEVAQNFTPADLLEVRVSATNLKRVYGTELAVGMAMLSSVKAQLLQDDSISENDRKTVALIWDKFSAALKIAINEMEGLRLVAGLTQGGTVNVSLAAQAKPGGEVQRVAQGLASSDLSGMTKAPQGSWLVLGYETGDMMRDFSNSLNSTSFAPVVALLELTEVEKKKLRELIERISGLVGGLSWLSLHADGSFPMGILLSVEVSDGAAAKAAWLECLSFFYEKGFDRLREFLPPALQTLPSSDFPQFVKAIGEIVQPMGVQLATKTNTEGDVIVHGLSITLDAAKAAEFDDESGENIKKLLKALGNTFELAVGFGSKSLAVAVGPTASAQAQRVLSGSNAGNNTDVARLLKQVPKGTGFVGQVDLGKAFGLFKPLVEIFQPGEAQNMDLFPVGSDFRTSLSGQGQEIVFGLSFPFDQIFMMGIKKTKEASPAGASGTADPARR